MGFFADKTEFTHYGRFYGVPIYLNLDGDCIVAGRNKVFDMALLFMTWFHNFFIERFTQLFAWIIGAAYEPGFPIWITGTLEGEALG
ncbi:MAG TPA: hypothetical protein VFI14_04250 [Chryseosolibacter sp.]|nr:hypothetical protein [Chryseosolibacter sp.]